MVAASLNNLYSADDKKGAVVVETYCKGCHQIGVLGAPKLGDKKDWQKRAEKGFEQLVQHAVNGFNSMPAKGGQPALTHNEVENAVANLLTAAGVDYADNPGPKAEPKQKTASKKTQKTVVREQPTKVEKKTQSKVKTRVGNSNRFNRLMKPREQWNPAPAKDGIHDPDNEGTYLLQKPKEAFADLNKSSSGNRVDWVKALENKLISPRFDLNDPDKEAFVMDLDIVREVKGSMPDVVYPHKQHTQWLDCSNCHPDIFIPKKGANQISMASILMGEKCGVCHGKVAFPVSECRRCHSKSKKIKSFGN